MKIKILAAVSLALAITAGALRQMQAPETVNAVRFEQIVSDDNQTVQPAQPNSQKSLRTVKEDTGWSAFTYGAVIFFGALFAWAIFSAHSDDQRFKKNSDDRLRTKPLPHPGKPDSFRMSSTPYAK